MTEPVYIIAEAGVNHNGNRDMAFQLVDAAVDAQADAIKFQTFKAENLVTRNAEKADYQRQTTSSEESQFEMLKQLELPHEWHKELSEYCKNSGIEFLSTAFDMESLVFLVNKMLLKTLKIPSGEITNGPFLLAHAQTGCDLIISTGMSTMTEVREALSVVAYGMLNSQSSLKPSARDIDKAFNSDEGRHLLREKITLLHCTTEYPAPLEDINLTAMVAMYEEFGVPVGYSDHSEGITVPVAAASLGAVLIEKHFTLDKTLPGPDHKASLEPNELTDMVQAIRVVEKILGDGIKAPKPSELGNRDIARKSLVAARDLHAGQIYNADMLTVKRPGTGISPMKYWDLLGTAVDEDMPADEVIK